MVSLHDDQTLGKRSRHAIHTFSRHAVETTGAADGSSTAHNGASNKSNRSWLSRRSMSLCDDESKSSKRSVFTSSTRRASMASPAPEDAYERSASATDNDNDFRYLQSCQWSKLRPEVLGDLDFISQIPPGPALDYESLGASLPLSRDPSKPSLFLDLDETLSHTDIDEHVVGRDPSLVFVSESDKALAKVFFRPWVTEFLQIVSLYFEIVSYTAALQPYADLILDELDCNRCISHRLYREHCTQYGETDVFFKDLHGTGRDIERSIIIDNRLVSFGLNADNGIFVTSYVGANDDTELLELIPLLLMLAGEDDVRSLLRKKYKLRDVIRRYQQERMNSASEGFRNILHSRNDECSDEEEAKVTNCISSPSVLLLDKATPGPLPVIRKGILNRPMHEHELPAKSRKSSPPCSLNDVAGDNGPEDPQLNELINELRAGSVPQSKTDDGTGVVALQENQYTPRGSPEGSATTSTDTFSATKKPDGEEEVVTNSSCVSLGEDDSKDAVVGEVMAQEWIAAEDQHADSNNTEWRTSTDYRPYPPCARNGGNAERRSMTPEAGGSNSLCRIKRKDVAFVLEAAVPLESPPSFDKCCSNSVDLMRTSDSSYTGDNFTTSKDKQVRRLHGSLEEIQPIGSSRTEGYVDAYIVMDQPFAAVDPKPTMSSPFLRPGSSNVRKSLTWPSCSRQCTVEKTVLTEREEPTPEPISTTTAPAQNQLHYAEPDSLGPNVVKPHSASLQSLSSGDFPCTPKTNTGGQSGDPLGRCYDGDSPTPLAGDPLPSRNPHGKYTISSASIWLPSELARPPADRGTEPECRMPTGGAGEVNSSPPCMDSHPASVRCLPPRTTSPEVPTAPCTLRPFSPRTEQPSQIERQLQPREARGDPRISGGSPPTATYGRPPVGATSTATQQPHLLPPPVMTSPRRPPVWPKNVTVAPMGSPRIPCPNAQVTPNSKQQGTLPPSIASSSVPELVTDWAVDAPKYSPNLWPLQSQWRLPSLTAHPSHSRHSVAMEQAREGYPQDRSTVSCSWPVLRSGTAPPMESRPVQSPPQSPHGVAAPQATPQALTRSPSYSPAVSAERTQCPPTPKQPSHICFSSQQHKQAAIPSIYPIASPRGSVEVHPPPQVNACRPGWTMPDEATGICISPRFLPTVHHWVTEPQTARSPLPTPVVDMPSKLHEVRTSSLMRQSPRNSSCFLGNEASGWRSASSRREAAGDVTVTRDCGLHGNTAFKTVGNSMPISVVGMKYQALPVDSTNTVARMTSARGESQHQAWAAGRTIAKAATTGLEGHAPPVNSITPYVDTKPATISIPRTETHVFPGCCGKQLMTPRVKRTVNSSHIIDITPLECCRPADSVQSRSRPIHEKPKQECAAISAGSAVRSAPAKQTFLCAGLLSPRYLVNGGSTQPLNVPGRDLPTYRK